MIAFQIFVKSKKYFASAFLFACFSLIFSTWVTYIPYVADKIGITEGKIGGALFFSSLGSLFMIPLANRFVDKIGVGRSTYYSLVVCCLSLFGPFLAYNYITLCIALLIFGMTCSAYAISLNSLLATIEKQDKVYIMTGSHGFWSIGAMIGAASGSFLATLISNPLLHILIILSIILSIQTYLKGEYIYRRAEQHVKEEHKKYSMRPLFVIAAMGLIMMVSEGAIADWSALYLKKVINIDVRFIGFGYATFSLAMTIGRFTGDWLSYKLGSWKLLTFSSALSLLGFVLVLFVNASLALLGFFIIGLGFSVIVPEIYRLAAKTKNINTSDGVSFIAATANIGFLIGPVLLGFLAELRTLHFSFMVLAFFVSIGFLIAFFKNRQQSALS